MTELVPRAWALELFESDTERLLQEVRRVALVAEVERDGNHYRLIVVGTDGGELHFRSQDLRRLTLRWQHAAAVHLLLWQYLRAQTATAAGGRGLKELPVSKKRGGLLTDIDLAALESSNAYVAEHGLPLYRSKS